MSLSALQVSSVFDYVLGSPLLKEVWRSVGTELAIFAATLVFGLLIRAFSGSPRAHGKAVVKAVATPTPEPEKSQQQQQQQQHQLQSSPARRQQPQGYIRSRNPAAALDDIVLSMREQPSLRAAGRALQVYNEELRSALRGEDPRLQEIARFSKSSPLDLYTTLVHCAVRAGRYHLVEPLIDDMTGQGVPRPLTFYESAMKQLAGQKQYHLALAVYDRLVADGLRASAVTCSCLIGFAAEVGELQRAAEFFESLAAITTPSIRAYMTVLRVHAKRQDFRASVDTLRDMEKRGVGVDSLALNVVLATGVAVDQIDAVAGLVLEADRRHPPTSDVVSYNTLVKGYAQRGDGAGGARAIDQMRIVGLKPNAITFNTAMDAAARGGDTKRAWKLLGDMRNAGLHPDKFTCSIMVKGLAAKEPSAWQVQEVLQLLQEVDSACDSTLRSTLYHTTLEAAAKATGPSAGPSLQARVFAQMRSHKVVPSASAQRLMVQALPGVSVDA